MKQGYRALGALLFALILTLPSGSIAEVKPCMELVRLQTAYACKQHTIVNGDGTMTICNCCPSGCTCTTHPWV